MWNLWTSLIHYDFISDLAQWIIKYTLWVRSHLFLNFWFDFIFYSFNLKTKQFYVFSVKTFEVTQLYLCRWFTGSEFLQSGGESFCRGGADYAAASCKLQGKTKDISCVKTSRASLKTSGKLQHDVLNCNEAVFYLFRSQLEVFYSVDLAAVTSWIFYKIDCAYVIPIKCIS